VAEKNPTKAQSADWGFHSPSRLLAAQRKPFVMRRLFCFSYLFSYFLFYSNFHLL
jgi:hypothetical protein